MHFCTYFDVQNLSLQKENWKSILGGFFVELEDHIFVNYIDIVFLNSNK